MALFNSFQFGDVDSKDYGVYISGDSVYDSPARSVDLVQVPGRNGALALDNGYYENIEVTYPAGSFGTSQAEWREKMLGIRNALAAQRGYQKLIDTYHPEHYRLGMFFAGISASPVQYNRAGQFPIRFNCKPQRFLISGDEAVEFTAEGQEEVYGPANIASFEAEEGAEIRQLEVDLEPVQDLNGYDNPWPAGGGKNKFDSSALVLKAWNGTGANTTRARLENAIQVPVGTRLTFSRSSTANYVFTIQELDADYPGNATTNPAYDIVTWSSAASYTWTTTHPYVGVLFRRTDSGNITLADLQAVQMQIEIGSTATAWTPYENICPISGHTEVNVYRTGKNVWDEEWEQGTYSTTTGAKQSSSAGRIRSANYISCKPNTAYYVPRPPVDGVLFYGSEKEYLGYTSTLGVVNTPNECHYMTFYSVTNYGTTYNNNISINYPSTDTEYHAYEGDTYNISLGQTVYGGALDVTTGVLTVDRAMVDMGTLAWLMSSSSQYGQFFYSSISGKAAGATNVLSDRYETKVRGDWTADIDSVISGNANSSQIYIKDSRYSSAADFKTAMNGVQLVYELATPTAVQLTATQVSTLLEANNIWSDSGEVEVTVAEPSQFENPTNFPAKPLIRVYGNGSVQVGDTIATVQNNADGYVDIDCESMNCYDTTGGRNADVSFSGNDFPELASGDNGILLTGPSRVEITPRWWEL